MVIFWSNFIECIRLRRFIWSNAYSTCRRHQIEGLRGMWKERIYPIFSLVVWFLKWHCVWNSITFSDLNTQCIHSHSQFVLPSLTKSYTGFCGTTDTLNKQPHMQTFHVQIEFSKWDLIWFVASVSHRHAQTLCWNDTDAVDAIVAHISIFKHCQRNGFPWFVVDIIIPFSLCYGNNDCSYHDIRIKSLLRKIAKSSSSAQRRVLSDAWKTEFTNFVPAGLKNLFLRNEIVYPLYTNPKHINNRLHYKFDLRNFKSDLSQVDGYDGWCQCAFQLLIIIYRCENWNNKTLKWNPF